MQAFVTEARAGPYKASTKKTKKLLMVFIKFLMQKLVLLQNSLTT